MPDFAQVLAVLLLGAPLLLGVLAFVRMLLWSIIAVTTAVRARRDEEAHCE